MKSIGVSPIAIARVVLFVSAVVLGCGSASAGEVVGQLTDPPNWGLVGEMDIISSWVEKDGANLTFVMEMRGQVPTADQLPNDRVHMTFLWLVDTDNNPDTGQSPGLTGSEFNVRVVVSKTPVAGGFVDVVGAMSGGGNGAVEIAGNLIRITIAADQIASPWLFHWRSDSFMVVDDQYVPGNGLTESAQSQTCEYAVLFEPGSDNHVADVFYEAFKPGDPDPNQILGRTNNNGGQYPVFLSIEGKYPTWQAEPVEVMAQASAHSTARHLRTSARLDIEWPAVPVWGKSSTWTIYDARFLLIGPTGATGPIPAGTFVMEFGHDYRLFAADMSGQSTAGSFAQIVITQADPILQMGVWVHADQAMNNDITRRHDEIIDLADYGLEYGVVYGLSILLVDEAITPVHAPSVYAEAVTDSDMFVDLQLAPLNGDVNGDRVVNLLDLAAMAANWLATR